MIIRRIRVRQFRKLTDQVLECVPGLNVLRGRNDAGKSTLHLAFSAALYPSKPKEVSSYGPWGEGQPGEITLEFEADGQEWRLHKDFRARKVALVSGEERWDDPREVERLIGDIVGLTSSSLFRAALHISHGELTTLAKEQQQEIGARLSRIMTGGDSDARRILRALDDKIRRLEVGLRSASKTPGPLRRDAEVIARLTEEQRRLAGELQTVEREAAERDRLVARIADLEQLVREDGALLEANRNLYALDGRVRDLSVRVAQAKAQRDRIAAATVELAAAEADPLLGSAPPNRDVLDNLRQASMRLQMLEGPVPPPATGQPVDAMRGPHADGITGVSIAAFMLVALCASIAGAVLLWGHQAPWGVGALLLAASCAAAAIAVRARAQFAAFEARMADRRSADLLNEMEKRRLEDRETTADEVRRNLVLLGATTVEDALDRQERYLAAERRRDEAKRRLDVLFGGSASGAAVEEEYQAMLRELAKAEALRDDPDLALRRLDPAAYQRRQTEAEMRKEELAAARASLYHIEGRLSRCLPHEDLARVEEELEEARARYARAQRHVEVLKLTRDLLDTAYRDTIVPGKVDLERRASRYLRALSGGAYDRLEVDAQTLAPRVWVGPPKEWADAAEREIGSGGVDQCYLALRLALVDLLCLERRRPPVFLDDPFLAYDEERQASALRFLCDLAGERQIFLFTCRGVYDAYADRVLVLEGVGAPAPAS
ncbi:MAG TPA: AAA family ATPase [bacterium]|nr:AAA family ATPase [bacterium]